MFLFFLPFPQTPHNIPTWSKCKDYSLANSSNHSLSASIPLDICFFSLSSGLLVNRLRRGPILPQTSLERQAVTATTLPPLLLPGLATVCWHLVLWTILCFHLASPTQLFFFLLKYHPLCSPEELGDKLQSCVPIMSALTYLLFQVGVRINICIPWKQYLLWTVLDSVRPSALWQSTGVQNRRHHTDCCWLGQTRLKWKGYFFTAME